MEEIIQTYLYDMEEEYINGSLSKEEYNIILRKYGEPEIQ